MSNLLGIENWLNQYVEKLSGGMKMKLALAQTLLLEPKILFLDEPAIGLDINTVNLFIDFIKKVKGIVIFTSHNLSVVEKLCDRIAFINEGEIIKIGAQEEVKKLSGTEISMEINLNKIDQKLILEISIYFLKVKKILFTLNI